MQFEYLIKQSYVDGEELNQLGEQGWELIWISESRYIFKRAVPENDSDWEKGEIVETPKDLDLKAMDASLVREALSVNNGNKQKACEVLGISMHTLNKKIKEYNIKSILL